MTTTLDLMCALARVKPLAREAFFDHHVLGMTYRELADRDGVSAQAIGLRVNAARKQLQRILNP